MKGDAGGTDTNTILKVVTFVYYSYMARGTLCAPGKSILFVCISSVVYVYVPKRRKDVLSLQAVFSLMHVTVAVGASALGLSTSRDVPVAL